MVQNLGFRLSSLFPALLRESRECKVVAVYCDPGLIDLSIDEQATGCCCAYTVDYGEILDQSVLS